MSARALRPRARRPARIVRGIAVALDAFLPRLPLTPVAAARWLPRRLHRTT
jgi:hypothetical protein